MAKFRTLIFFMFVRVVWRYMCSENYGTIKELLVLEFDKKRSKNKELLELGRELGSFLKQKACK